MSQWAPVVAALGASALTGVFGFGGLTWQQRRRDRSEAAMMKAAAYHEMIARSLSFLIRARVLRTTMQARSGISEGIDLLTGARKPLDPMELNDWLARDFDPINNAWTMVEIRGSEEAIGVASQLILACGDLVGLATEMGEAHGRVASAVKGLKWTPEQEAALTEATARVGQERTAFIKIARRELGNPAVPEIAEIEPPAEEPAP